MIADLGFAFASGQVYVALSRCTTFSGLVLKTRIGDEVIKTDPKVLEFAQNETPSTLIVQELNSGKADFYYKKSREAIDGNNYVLALEIFLKAIKFRNDLETNIFQKYFSVTGRKLSSYKMLFQRTTEELEKVERQLSDLNTTNGDLRSIVESQNGKVEEQNKSIKLLQNKVDELSIELRNSRNESQNMHLNMQEAESQSLTVNRYAQKLKIVLDSTKQQQQKTQEKLMMIIEKSKQQSTDIKNLTEIITQQSGELQRLKELKFHQRILGVK